MDHQSRATIIVAVIAAVQAILITAITAGWNFFGLIERGEDPARTVAQQQLTSEVLPLVVPVRGSCIGRLTGELLDRGFEDSGTSDDAAIVRRGAFKAAIWCRPTEIVVTVAGRRGSDTEDVVSMVERSAAAARLIEAE